MGECHAGIDLIFKLFPVLIKVFSATLRHFFLLKLLDYPLLSLRTHWLELTTISAGHPTVEVTLQSLRRKGLDFAFDLVGLLLLLLQFVVFFESLFLENELLV